MWPYFLARLQAWPFLLHSCTPPNPLRRIPVLTLRAHSFRGWLLPEFIDELPTYLKSMRIQILKMQRVKSFCGDYHVLGMEA